MLIDTHAHLYWESYKEDFEGMIQRCVDADIATIINSGVDVEKSQIALDQAKNTKWPQGFSVYSTIGIHPHEAVKYFPNPAVSIHQDIEKLEQICLSDTKKVVGVGECGLDYLLVPEYIQTPDNTPLSSSQIKDLQKQLFQAQIDLAKKLKLPLVVHCRDDRSQNFQNSEAWDEILKMVGTHPTVLHCYSGLPQTTGKILQASNFIVSFAGNITYPKNEYLREAAKILPLDKIILETDAPFLSPQSKRGQRNEPSTVKEIAYLIAEIKGVSFEEVASQTSQNAKRIFAF